ncbi:two-component regulator propeller domain-containing protein [Flavitalea sp.]|nr:two-component regulator propeller domain-containing protein [Flavitalea sp.]
MKLFCLQFLWHILKAIFVLFPYCLFANDSLKYSVQHYTDENGLPQNSIKSIAPDKAGFIWLATENGILRFDGHSLRRFDKQNLSLASSRIYSILPVPAGDLLYALTDGQEIICIEKGKVSVYPHHLKRFLKKYFFVTDDTGLAYQGLPHAYYKDTKDEDLFLLAGSNDYYLITKDSIIFYRNYKPLYIAGHSSQEKLIGL